MEAKVTGSIYIKFVNVEDNKIDLNRIKYAFEYIEYKTKFTIKKLEGDKYHQLFIYIVPSNMDYVECCNCDFKLTEIEN
jgi:hypothetical protein